MEILLTGADGFVGRHLATQLRPSHSVISITRRHSGAKNEVKWDLAQPLPSNRFPEHIDTVIHTAGLVGGIANSSSLCRRINVDATNELVRYAVRAKASRFVFLSTGGVYQHTREKLTEESLVVPSDAYTQSKLDAEISLNDFKGDLAVQVLRLFFPYGPTQRGRFIPNLIEQVAQHKTVRISNAIGEPLVTPLFIDDLLEYLGRFLGYEDTVTVNVSGSELVSMRMLAEAIGELLNRSVHFEVLENERVANWWGDNDRLSRLTDYRPKVSLECGLKRTIAEMYQFESSAPGQESCARK